ncbi:CKLF-like MARVEL transmembrane domain-containing protein 6 [Pteropus alecto]|uniref:CKLF-like MARVEL transmembrane domain-containing protein 6 n=1 Tax=Pteropus alecto TaxID=9402 RepID=L5L2K6_PTEAL|nr:CKLF-like MARVEL transmembrane domain-containing protein 6 [Pteropus alecto]ELK17949.1 CKLF-like MARVEL transmembrane domain-containing protein 6 [Pteropus alecto]
MENGAVYSPTTEEHPAPARGARSGLAAYFFLGRLKLQQRVLKLLQLVLSLLAFICEEVVSQCTLCGGLYFFEFVSCSAFLLSLLILIVYCTPVYDRVDAVKVKSSDFYITVGIGLLFLLASIIFVSTHDRTSAEFAATVFGFLASIMFLLDFLIMFYEKRQESQLRKPEPTTKTENVTEPLNA